MTVRSGPERNDTGVSRPTGRVGEQVRTVEAAAIAGIVYAVLNLVTRAILGTIPNLDDSDVVAWFNERSNQDRLLLALNLTSIGTVAFLWFVAVIRRRIGDREDQFFSTVFVGSGLVLIVSSLLATGAAVSPAIAVRFLGAEELDSAVISVAEAFGATVALVLAPRMEAVFVIATSTVLLRSRALPIWLAYMGYAVGAVKFIVPILIEPMNLMFPAWVLLVSFVVLVTRTRDLDDSDDTVAATT